MSLSNIIQVLSIYSSNAYIELIFIIINNICSDDRSIHLTPNLKAELCVKVNYDLKCLKFLLYKKNNDELLNACNQTLNTHLNTINNCMHNIFAK
jgi:hypothetical protein